MSAARRELRRAGAAMVVAAITLAGARPAAAQTYAIRGGTIHTLTGDPFVGTVVVQGGKIVAVGPDVQVPSGAKVVDATGKQIYPGLFDAISELGLTEVGAVDVTNDSREQGSFNPQLQAATAVHPASEHIPVARANGITHTIAVPQGGNGAIVGQGSLIGLDGWTIDEMDIQPGAGMVVNFPSLSEGGRGFGGGFGRGGPRSFPDREAQYRKEVAELDEWMDAGRHYIKAKAAGEVTRDLGLEAMAKVVSKEMPVLLEANSDRDIKNAVEWAKKQDIRFVITGARQGWRVADYLARNHVSVILGPTQDLPQGADAAYDEAYANPGKLYAAGVKIAFATFNSSDSRTLPYEAAMAVPFGLPEEAALAAVTRNGAEMLGYGDQLGTIEKGKVANLIVTDGDPLQIRTQVLDLFILGRQVSTDNRQRALYEKYKARPKEKVIS
jgi:imidazolonepropionase-like amidohydrolase